jgi:integrase
MRARSRSAAAAIRRTRAAGAWPGSERTRSSERRPDWRPHTSSGAVCQRCRTRRRHTLRRTYISIALLANRFDVLWVMRQVGHADSKMTMDVYAQLQQRAERQHGEAFDALVRRARVRLYGTTERPDAADPADAAPMPDRL